MAVIEGCGRFFENKDRGVLQIDGQMLEWVLAPGRVARADHAPDIRATARDIAISAGSAILFRGREIVRWLHDFSSSGY
jgi:hypothetical protein